MKYATVIIFELMWITNNNLLLMMVDIERMADDSTFYYFPHKFITCSFCKKGSDIVSVTDCRGFITACCIWI